MSFRDDQEALASRLERVSYENKEQQQQIEKLHREVQRLRDEVERLGRPNAVLSRQNVSRSVLLPGAISVGSTLFLWLLLPAPAPQVILQEAPQPKPPEAAAPTPPVPIKESPAAPAPPKSPEPRLDNIKGPWIVRWAAQIDKAQGTEAEEKLKRLSVGTQCELSARYKGNILSGIIYGNEEPEQLDLICGEQSVVSLAAFRCSTSGQATDKVSIVLRCDARDLLDEYPELELDTSKRTLTLYQGSAWEIRFTLGSPFGRNDIPVNKIFHLRLPPLAKEATFSAEVTEVQGDAPFKQGALCELRVTPQDNEHKNCKASLRCGDNEVLAIPAQCKLNEELLPISVSNHPREETTKTFSFDIVEGGQVLVTEPEKSWGIKLAPR